jgi:hypothetical protein
LGWKTIGVSWVDVDFEEAARINLIDNRANDVASYDVDVLAQQLQDLPTLSGTGYSDLDAQAIIASIDSGDVEAAIEVMRPVAEIQESSDPFDDITEVEGGGSYAEWEADEGIDFKHDVSEQLGGVVQLSPSLQFDFLGAWHIPQLRPDLLVQPEDLPDKLMAWAGSATKYDPEKDWPEEDQWWLYNYGIDSTSGMRDISKLIMSFYCWDEYFECWWDYPDRYTTKMINSGVTMSVQPDFSQNWDEPRIVSFWNIYRNFWLARYFQEAGIKIIPSLTFRYLDDDYQQRILPLWPKAPVMAMEFGNLNPDMTVDETDQYSAQIKACVEHVEPEVFIVYGSQRGYELIDSLDLTCTVRWIENRIKALADKAKRKGKKTTL